VRISESEWKVMDAVWRRESATAREVHDDLAGETRWAYTTVKTLLDRLAEKGALRVAKRGNTGVYSPAVTKDEARRTALRGLLDRAFDGAFGPLLHHLIEEEKLSKRDRAELRRLLDGEEGP